MTVATFDTKNRFHRLRELLSVQGYKTDEPDTNWLWVIVDGFYFVIENWIDDAEFYRVSFPIGLDEKGKEERYLKAVNLANEQSKLAKAFMEKDANLTVAVDVITSKPEDFVAHFSRYVSAIQTSYKIIDDFIGE